MSSLHAWSNLDGCCLRPLRPDLEVVKYLLSTPVRILFPVPPNENGCDTSGPVTVCG
jgi:hypothetical protein